ncbi:MAG: hypothetical protein B6D56_06975 [Candidatus Omnitrophica bacterium 4484_70.1]|nr:MAG: hypothetical protein B6D56_06975 [Candidatus Omnitrophica bacterium 4484_70.1]
MCKEKFPYTINLYETKRAEDTLLYEPFCSGKMVSCPLGLYFIDNHWGFKYKFNKGYHNFN